MFVYSLAFLMSHIVLGPEPLQVELALTQREHGVGLMQRTELPEGRGMLFIYQEAEILSFWMKDTKIPLSVGFFDKNRRLLEIQHMQVSQEAEPPLYVSGHPAQYALEVPLGWFERHGISPGASFQWR